MQCTCLGKLATTFHVSEKDAFLKYLTNGFQYSSLVNCLWQPQYVAEEQHLRGPLDSFLNPTIRVVAAPNPLPNQQCQRGEKMSLLFSDIDESKMLQPSQNAFTGRVNTKRGIKHLQTWRWRFANSCSHLDIFNSGSCNCFLTPSSSQD